MMKDFPVPPSAMPSPQPSEPSSSSLGDQANGRLSSPDTSSPTVRLTPENGRLSSPESEFILNDKLSRKHREDPTVLAFIDSFIRCKNIEQASREAGVSPKLGYLYRHRVDIASAITALIDKSAIKYGFDASEIVERTKEVLDFDPISLVNPDGTYRKMHEIPAEARRQIKKLKVKNIWGEREDMNGIKTKIIIGEIIDYELVSPGEKLKAAELLGREKDIYKQKSTVEHGVTKDMQSFLLESARRGDEAQSRVGYNRVVEAEIVTKEDEDV